MIATVVAFLVGTVVGVLLGRRLRVAEVEGRLAGAEREVAAARVAFARAERGRRRLVRRLGGDPDHQ